MFCRHFWTMIEKKRPTIAGRAHTYSTKFMNDKVKQCRFIERIKHKKNKIFSKAVEKVSNDDAQEMGLRSKSSDLSLYTYRNVLEFLFNGKPREKKDENIFIFVSLSVERSFFCLRIKIRKIRPNRKWIGIPMLQRNSKHVASFLAIFFFSFSVWPILSFYLTFSRSISVFFSRSVFVFLYFFFSHSQFNCQFKMFCS